MNLGTDEVNVGDLGGGITASESEAETGLISTSGENSPTVHATRVVKTNVLSEGSDAMLKL